MIPMKNLIATMTSNIGTVKKIKFTRSSKKALQKMHLCLPYLPEYPRYSFENYVGTMKIFLQQLIHCLNAERKKCRIKKTHLLAMVAENRHPKSPPMLYIIWKTDFRSSLSHTKLNWMQEKDTLHQQMMQMLLFDNSICLTEWFPQILYFHLILDSKHVSD